LYAPDVQLSQANGESTTVTIGTAAHTDQFTPPDQYRIHIIVEVEDGGTPALIHYRRAIITVPGVDFGVEAGPCQVKVV